MNIDTNLELTRSLAVLQTKIDYLIEASNLTAANHISLAKRVDDLENHRHWLTGGVAGLMVVSGLLVYGLRSQVAAIAAGEIAKSELTGEKLIDLMCDAYRVQKVEFNERPIICRI